MKEYLKIMAKKKKVSDEHRIGYDFSIKTYKKFKEIIKAIVYYPGVIKSKDIDLVIIIDDCVIDWDQELIAWYREELEKLVKRQKYAARLKINTVTLTSFWEELRSGEPLIINLVRYGQVMVDVGGFFDPIRVLLARGRIRPTTEAVYVTMTRASNHLFKASNSMLLSVQQMYWAMIDASHAVLMAENEVPVAPEFIVPMLDDVFVSKKKLDRKYIRSFEEVRDVALKIGKGTRVKVTGKDMEELFLKAKNYVDILRELGSVLIKEKKIIRQKKKKV